MLKGGSLVSHISILYGNVCLGTLLLHLIEVSGGGEGGGGRMISELSSLTLSNCVIM